MVTGPQTISLDGGDWTVYPLSPGTWAPTAVVPEDTLPARVPGYAREAFHLPYPLVESKAAEWAWTSER